MIYLDANATTPLDPAVMAAMLPALGEVFANPSSVHKAGQDARALLDRAREQCGAALDCDPREIVFTSGGTEADALAVRGLGRRKVVTTAVEHPALLGACAELERAGAGVIRVPVDRAGQLDLAALDAALPGADLCSAMAANNETGVVFPLSRIGELCRKHRVPFHTDAVQAAGKMPVRVRELPIDLLSCSAHKIGGPKGAGLLWVRRGIQLAPVQVGGHQERGRRAGTENVAGIVGLGEALSRAAASLSTEAPRLAALRDRLEAAARQIPGSRVAGSGTERVCNTLNVAFEGCDGETLLVALDLAGVAVSTGSACSSGSLEPSPVLLAMGHPPALARGAVRFSLWRGTRTEEIEEVCRLLPEVVARTRSRPDRRPR
ncbi:MAG TPA: cysteine desulfurase family protein [Myxococcales bacterium]|nr:cysteine desulfurase family protein [Myxococcales bacterium]